MQIAFIRPALTAAAIIASAGILAGGLALRPAFAVGGTAIVGPFTITHCSKTTACKTYSNAGVGAGAQGINTDASGSGAGLLGTASQGASGVFGTSMSGIGVDASSNTGVGAEGYSNTSYGVEGISSASDGVFGTSTSSNGVLGSTSSSDPAAAGVQGDNTASTIAVRANGFGGLLFDGNSSAGTDVFSVFDDGTTLILAPATITGSPGLDGVDAGASGAYRGVAAEAFVGVAGYGLGNGSYGVLGLNDGGVGGQALAAQDLTTVGELINGFDSGGNLKFQVADDGTVYAHNFVQAFDTPKGPKVSNYATMSRTPNIEDFGEGQLTGGQAYVGLERTFGAEIDSRIAYMVFITPEGDTHGLYVTQKTPAGFVVRENQGGRSDAAFSYRIVAKPYDSTSAPMRPSVAPSRRLQNFRAMPKVHRVPKKRP